jgi:hypothetical protein
MAFRTMTAWTMTIEMLAVTAEQWRVILLLAMTELPGIIDPRLFATVTDMPLRSKAFHDPAVYKRSVLPSQAAFFATQTKTAFQKFNSFKLPS